MKKQITNLGMKFSAFLTAGLMSGALSDSAYATASVNLADMANTTGANTAAFPKLISAACYVGGAALVGTGVMKVKQHVDNPGQTPLREGLVRLGAGGVLVAAPALTAVMTNSGGVGDGNRGFSEFGFSSY